MGGTGPDTTVTQEVVVVGSGVNYDANRGVGAPELVTVLNCRAALENSVADLKRALPLGDDSAILGARLVYAGPSPFDPVAAQDEFVEYRPAWMVTFRLSPHTSHPRGVLTVLLDAVSGEYISHAIRQEVQR